MNAFWSFQWSWSIAVFGALALALTAVFSWLQCRREPKARALRVLEALRFVWVALLVFTLFQPERVRPIRATDRPRIAVLGDASGSMATVDVATNGTPAVARAAWLKAQRDRKFWAPLEQRYTVTVEDFAAPGDARDPSEAGTDLGAALDAARESGRNLRAVVLLSDGDWNQGRAPVSAATRLQVDGVPVYAVTVGNDRYLPDLDLQSALAPAYGLVEEQISIPFTLQSRLPREVRTTLTLETADGVAARKDLVIPPYALVQDAIVLTPAREGDQDFRLVVPQEPDEVRADNNLRAFPMAIRREKLKVLLLDSVPRWEYRYLRNALLRDPGAEVRCLLLHPGLAPGGGLNYLSAFPTADELSTYDVVFLGDLGIGPGELTAEQAQLLRGLVEEQGSGLVFLPGRRGRQATLAGSPLDKDFLPVDVRWDGGARAGAYEERLALTRGGREHLLTLLTPDPAVNAELWRTLPGFTWYAPVVRARSGCDVLGVHASARNDFGRIPLLVTREARHGKVLYMGADAAWRWRRGVEDTYHYRLWGQVIRWMAHRRHLAHAEGLRFFFTPEKPALRERVLLHATAFDAAGRPLQSGTVEVGITHPDGREESLPLDPQPGGWGVFTGAFTPEAGGRYTLTARCRETGREARAALEVARPALEAIGRPARGDVLRELAALTGGRATDTGGLDQLIADLRVLPDPQPREARLRLWCHPLWGGLLVLLAGVYWAGRKWVGKI